METETSPETSGTELSDNHFIFLLHEPKMHNFFVNVDDYIIYLNSTPETIASLQYKQLDAKQIIEIINQVVGRVETLNADPSQIQKVDQILVNKLSDDDTLSITKKQINFQEANLTFDCDICLDTFKHRKKYKKLDCSHKVHEYCASHWILLCRDLNLAKECPRCKQQNHPNQTFSLYLVTPLERPTNPDPEENE
jgi:hypothetical protein